MYVVESLTPPASNPAVSSFSALSPESIQAATNLDKVIDNLSKNFSENNDYFKVLVTVFEENLQITEQGHLNHFYST